MKNENRITFALFMTYFIILSWIILFKMAFSLDELHYLYRARSINLIPFGQSVIANGTIYVKEIIDNLIVFIPIGIYLEMLKPEWSFLRKACVPLGISLMYELLQLIFAIGSTDITDLITNTSGGVIGILLCFVLRKLLKDKTNKVLNSLAAICTVGLILLLGVLMIGNL